MNARMIGLSVGMAVAAASICGATPPEPSFEGIGVLPGGLSSGAFAISSDGTTVVGWATHRDGILEAVKWTPGPPVEGIGQGLCALGYLPGTLGDVDVMSEAHGVSADGSVIVGMSTSQYGVEAFRWTPLFGMEGLGDLPSNNVGYGSIGMAVTDTGQMIVGSGAGVFCNVQGQAFVWTPESGMVGIGYLPTGRMISQANDVSADGHMIVGWGQTDLGIQAGVWQWGSPFVPLGELPGDDVSSRAFAVSKDGSTIVGTSSGTFDQHAVMWRFGEITDLGLLPAGSVAAEAFDVSADGSVIVGTMYTDQGDQAFVWTERHGMRNLAEVLSVDYALNLDGWTLTRANGVSEDGMWITGEGFAPDGHQEGWIASIMCPADYNGDFKADISDFVQFQMFAQAGNPIADCDKDGIVDILDYVCFVRVFANGCP